MLFFGGRYLGLLMIPDADSRPIYHGDTMRQLRGERKIHSGRNGKERLGVSWRRV